jgi:rubrerythrin
VFSALFGLSTLHVHARWTDADTVQIRISSAAGARILADLKELAAQSRPAAAPAVAPPMVVQQVILREIVKIPCRFCGSLIENTQTRCPFCGGE